MRLRTPEVGIDIAAAGQAMRLREHITELGFPENYPKLLLPTGNPNDETLLGRIIRQSLDAPIDGSITVHTSDTNMPHIVKHPDIEPLLDEHTVKLETMEYGNGFLAFIPKLVESKIRVIGSSADYYADFRWGSILDQHESNPFPVSFVAGQTAPVEGGLVFDVEDSGKVNGFHRPDRTKATDLINVGVYIFEPSKAVLGALNGLVGRDFIAKEEIIVRQLTEKGLLGLIPLESTPYNVNTPETYQNLLNHTATNLAVSGD
jgi:hypothetical protein